jgi:IS30 family transposase
MMQQKYGRLCFDERIEIEKLLSHKKSYADIATALSRSKSTVQRDVIKQGIEHYKAMQAERLAVGKSSNRKSGKTKINVCEALQKYMLEKLALRWSPWQISISLQRQFPENKAMQISHEAIYLYIYLHSKKELKSLLISQLRQKRKYRGNVRRGADKRTTIQDPVRIDERPEEVKGRLIPGHWEGDLVMGKERSSAIGTLVERTTRTIIIVPLKATSSSNSSNQCHPHLFSYLNDGQIPKSTNQIEGYFYHLKEKLSLHRGLRFEAKKNFIKWYLHFKNQEKRNRFF